MAGVTQKQARVILRDEVKRLIELLRTGVAGVTQKQARVILRDKVKRLIELIRILRDKAKYKGKNMLILRDIAIFSLAFCTAKRGDDISKLVAKKCHENAK